MDARTMVGAAAGALLAMATTLGTAGCGGAQLPADARTTVLSMKDLDCASCGEELATHLSERQGVYKSSFDRRKAELTVVASPSTDVLGSARQLASASTEKYELVLGAGQGRYLPPASVPAGADVLVVAKDGADVPDLAPHLVAGKVTVVDFFAPWCEPCRKVDEHVAAVISARADVAYRKLDIGDWDTPLAHRYMTGIPSLPYVLVFGKDKRKIDTIAGLDLAKLDAAIAKGSQ